jgi:integrase
MRGSVIRRGDVYYVKIELDPDPGTGRRRTKWHSGYRTKREAERARVDLLSKVDRGVYVEPSAETVAEFLDHWLVSIRPTLKATTWNGYRSKVRNHVVPYIGGMRLNRIDGGTLNELYARLLEGGRRRSSRTGKGYSPEVVAGAQALRAEGLSLQATADRLQVEFDEADHMQTWTPAQLRTFLGSTESSADRNHALWVLLATTGMRRGEALGVRWQDVDLDAGRLRVVQTVLSINGKISVSEPKTARGRRPIALDPSTVAVLREHRRRMLEERMLVGPDHSDEGLVFHRPDGSALRPETVSATFLRRQAKLDLPRLMLKGLRHTWATIALEQGIHPKVVQERLGHSTINITIDIYSHVSPTMHDDAANQIANLILGAPRDNDTAESDTNEA